MLGAGSASGPQGSPFAKGQWTQKRLQQLACVLLGRVGKVKMEVAYREIRTAIQLTTGFEIGISRPRGLVS